MQTVSSNAAQWLKFLMMQDQAVYWEACTTFKKHNEMSFKFPKHLKFLSWAIAAEKLGRGFSAVMQRGMHNPQHLLKWGFLCVAFSCQTTLTTKMQILEQAVTGFFLGCAENYRITWEANLTSEEKMHGNTRTYWHLAFSVWTTQKSLVSTVRLILPVSNIPFPQAANNWIKLSEASS